MVFIEVKVVPNASKSQIILDKNLEIKCYLVSVPEDGKANKELIKLLSDKLKVPKSAIDIEKGLISRNKRISIAGYNDIKEIYDALGFVIQSKI